MDSITTVRTNCIHSMQNLGGIDLSCYNPVHPPSYYGSVSICDNGSVRPTEPFSESVFTFLSSINADTSLWDGSRGVLGRAYCSSHVRGPVQRQPLDTDQIRILHARYVELKHSMHLIKTQHELQKELNTKCTLHTQFMEAIDVLERKRQALRKYFSDGTENWGKWEMSSTGSNEDLKEMMERTNGELERTTAAVELLEKKIMEARMNMAERRNGFLRQLSIMHKLFIDANVEWEWLGRFFGGEDVEEMVKRAERVERRCGECWMRTVRAKRFYVDAKLGLWHLYQVEGVLKGILEHLWEAMQSHRGVREKLPSVVGVQYRLGYVQRQWGEVERGMKEGMKYLRATSLNGGIGEEVVVDGFLTKVGRGWGMGRGERIRTLYEAARDGYRRVNKIFDEQKEWVERSLEEVRGREREEMEQNERLIELWERLVGVEDGRLCVGEDDHLRD